MHYRKDPRPCQENLPGEYPIAKPTHVKSEHSTQTQKLANDKNRISVVGVGQHPFFVRIRPHQTLNLDFQHK